MKLCIVLLTALFFNAALAVAQNTPKVENGNDLHHKRISITGCLTKDSHNQFNLVDQGGIENSPYSGTVNLDQYVGQIVTLVGRRALMPSDDTGVRKPHFQVYKVQSASGKCNK